MVAMVQFKIGLITITSTDICRKKLMTQGQRYAIFLDGD